MLDVSRRAEDLVEKREVTIVEDAYKGFEDEGFISGDGGSALRAS